MHNFLVTLMYVEEGDQNGVLKEHKSVAKWECQAMAEAIEIFGSLQSGMPLRHIDIERISRKRSVF